MTDQILGLPAKYIQGPGALDRLGRATASLGATAVLIGDEFVLNLLGSKMSMSLKDENIEHSIATFGGECCRPEINRLVSIARSKGAEVIIAVGGGKALDTGKAVSSEAGTRLICAPTIASTDGPVSSIAVEYSPDHEHIGVMRFNQSPSIVLVDSTVIANAPGRLLVAGMGDGLATWLEARACATSGKKNFGGGSISPVAMTLARSCHDTILEFGRAALAAVNENTVTEAVEKVIEANIFLSGVGFENTGVAGAHALDTAVSRFTSDHSIHHGERVALGVLFQLHLENDQDQIDALLPFYRDVGLPTTLSEINLGGIDDGQLNKITALILREGSPIRNLPTDHSADAILQALQRLR